MKTLISSLLSVGKTWAMYDLKQFGDRSGVRVNPRNSDGWFRLCLRERWMNRAEVLFIKPAKLST